MKEVKVIYDKEYIYLLPFHFDKGEIDAMKADPWHCNPFNLNEFQLSRVIHGEWETQQKEEEALTQGERLLLATKYHNDYMKKHGGWSSSSR